VCVACLRSVTADTLSRLATADNDWSTPLLAAVLVGLYEEPERPPVAVDYVKRYLGTPVGVDIDALKAENERLKGEVASLHQQLEVAQRTIAAHAAPK
jgi:hypothetical protein